MDIRDIRLARLQQLLVDHKDNKAALARSLKKHPAQVSQWFSGIRTITEDSARDIEKAAGKPKGWLDTPTQSYGVGGIVAMEQPQQAYLWPLGEVSAKRFYRLPSEEQQKIVSHASFICSEWESKAGHEYKASESAA
jgi:hypothetical protein